MYVLFLTSLTATTSLQVAVHLVSVTDLDPIHFSVMNQGFVNAITTPWEKSVICVNGDSLGFQMLRVKVSNVNASMSLTKLKLISFITKSSRTKTAQSHSCSNHYSKSLSSTTKHQSSKSNQYSIILLELKHGKSLLSYCEHDFLSFGKHHET